MESSLRYNAVCSKIPYTKYDQSFRMVTKEDYLFIYQLRTDKWLGRFLSETNINPEYQRLWISEYKKRESLGEDFYFMCFDPKNNERFGMTRLYNFSSETLELGSWVFRHGQIKKAILGWIITAEIGFDILKYEKLITATMKGNKSVLQFLQSFQPVLENEDELQFYFEISKSNFEKNKQKYLTLPGYGPVK